MTRRRWSRLIFATVVATVTAGSVVASLLTKEPRSAFSEAGTGPFAVVEEADAAGLEPRRLLSGPLAFDQDSLPAARLVVLAVIGPESPYSRQEAAAVMDLVHGGGTLLLADNFEQGNSLAKQFGITFERVRLVDPDKDNQFSAIFDNEAFHLLMPNPTALRLDPETSAKIIASSSTESFLDRDGDGVISSGDPIGPFPVAVEVAIGPEGGRIIAIADTGLFRTTAGEPPDNRRFQAALLTSRAQPQTVLLVDESRTATQDPWLFALRTVGGVTTTSPWNHVLVGLAVAVLATGTAIVLKRSWGAHVQDATYFVPRASIVGDGPTAENQGPPGHPEPDASWTRRGQTAIFGGLALAVFGAAADSVQATVAACLLLLAATMAVTMRPRAIAAARQLSEREAPEDSQIQVDLLLESSHYVEFEVLDRLPREFAVVSGTNWFRAAATSHTPVRASYTVRPGLRGPYAIGPTLVRMTDPFRLRMVEPHAGAPDELRVQPRHESVSRLPFLSKLPLVTLGPHLVSRSGDGAEFHSLRDYQYGDSLRSVNWKASARSTELKVNQRVHESRATIHVFVDARAISGAGPIHQSPLNQACRVALTIATGAIRARDRVRVFAYGDGFLGLTERGVPDQIQSLTSALAELRPAGATPFAAVVQSLLAEVTSGSPVVLVSGLEADPTIVDGLRELRSRGARPAVVALDIGTEPDSSREAAPEPDAADLHAERDRTLAAVQAAGVPVWPVQPGIPLSVLFRQGGR